MRKLIGFFIMVILMMSTICYATTEEGTVEENTEEITEEQENVDDLEDTTTISNTVEAIVTEAGEVQEVETGSITDKVQELTIEILEGEYEAEEYTTDYVLSYDMEGKILAYELEVGDKVMVQITEDESGNVAVSIQDPVRTSYIAWAIVLFIICAILVTGKKSIKVILSCIIGGVTLVMLIKGIYSGQNTFGIAIEAVFVATVFTLIINWGFNKKTMITILSAFDGVILSGIIAYGFCYFAKISGVSEDILALSMSTANITFDFKTIIFAGVTFVTIGLCMDIAFDVISKLDEAKNKTQDFTWQQLFKDGIDVGKDIIVKKAPILIYIYGGSIITSALALLAGGSSVNEILNKETISSQVISSISGTIGIILTVPIAAIFYAILNRSKTIYKTTSENKVDGNRSLKI